MVWILAYLVLPAIWQHYEHNPKLATSPKVTRTADGIPGDLLNLGLVRTRSEVVQALLSKVGIQPSQLPSRLVWASLAAYYSKRLTQLHQ